MHLLHDLKVGGVEMMVVELASRQHTTFRVSICCFDGSGSLAAQAESNGVDVQVLRRKPGVDWRYPFKLARLLKKQRIDILQLHNPTAFFYGTLAGRLARTPCVIYTEHGRDVSYGWKVRLGHRLLSKMVDEIVAVGDHGKHFLSTEEGIDSRKITRIYNGVAPESFDYKLDMQSRHDVRQMLGLEAGTEPVIGIVARLDPIKNHSSLLRAMKKVVSDIPSTVLLVVGDGPEEERLRKCVKDMKLNGSVCFLGSRENIPELLKIMDLFVLPSYSEGISMTLIEACAAGKPIVATNVGGNPEIVEHGENGLLVESDDSDALASAIVEILSDPVRAQEMGVKARLKFERQFTIGQMVANYERLYRKYLS